MLKQILRTIITVFILSLLLTGETAFAQQAIDPRFNANKLIEDAAFTDTATFGSADGVQQFLVSKGSPLANTSADFVAMLKEPSSASLKQALDDPNPNLSRNRTAAELIYDSSVRAGLNPQVMLSILNKEQGLITGRRNVSTATMQTALDHAVGYGCQGSNCQSIYIGFYFQLFGNVDESGNRYLGAARSLIRAFSVPGGTGPMYNGKVTRVGDTVVFTNSVGGYANVPATQSVTLENRATAVMYRYDPTVFNSNYNFWRFFDEWFRYPNGTVLNVNGNPTLYVIQAGGRYRLLPFVAQARNIQTNTAIVVSQNEVASYPEQGLLGLPDNTIISVDSKLYVFMNNVKRPASRFVITQRGLNPAAAITVAGSDAQNFADGPALTPSEGTVLRGQNNHAVYLVEGGVLKLFTAATFAQRKASSKVQIIPDSEIDSYSKQGLVPPLDGSLIKSSTSAAVYLLEAGQKRPLSGELFRNRGFSFANILVLSSEEVDSYPSGSMPAPGNMTFFTNAKTGEFWVFINGGKHKISSFVAAQKKLSPDYAFDAAYVDSLTISTPIIPKDNTIIKGDQSADVYIVVGGVLRPLTYQAFVGRKITVKQISVLPQSEVDSYVKGALLTK